MTRSFPTPRRWLRFAIAAAGLACVVASVGGSAASPAPSVGPDACFEYGREIRDLAWDVTGSHLAVLSWYHRDSRVDVIDWPSMTIRQVDSSPYAYIDHGESVAVDADGTVWWSGYEADGPRITRARPGSGHETWWPAGKSGRLRAVRQLYRTPDGLELNGAIERGKATYSRHVWIDDADPATARHDRTRLVNQFYVTPDGRTRLFTGNRDLPFGSIEVQAHRGSSVVQIDQYGWDLSLSPDGRHILWAEYEQLMTRPVEGGEAVLIADAYRTASVGPHGIIAHPARSQRFADLWGWDDGTREDPPLLPDRLCFALAPWASLETPIPAMPPGETVAIEEPARPLPEAVRSLSALLPKEVDGHDVSWSGDVLESPRESSSYEFPRLPVPPALPFAARELGVDPFDLFIGQGNVWSDDPEDYDDAAQLTVWADPEGDGSRWVEPLVRALETYGRRTRVATLDAITLAGREVMRVEAKDPGVEFGHQTDYVLTSGPYVFLINTNIRSMAKEVVAALP